MEKLKKEIDYLKGKCEVLNIAEGVIYSGDFGLVFDYVKNNNLANTQNPYLIGVCLAEVLDEYQSKFDASEKGEKYKEHISQSGLYCALIDYMKENAESYLYSDILNEIDFKSEGDGIYSKQVSKKIIKKAKALAKGKEKSGSGYYCFKELMRIMEAS